jgi:hypothetical protein
MKARTVLQRITDTLETAGITVSAIETWPKDEDGRVSVSLMVWLPPPGPGREETEAFLAALNADRDPSWPPVVRDPCADCGDGGCDTCPMSPASSTPIKLYTPEEAAAAMIAGRVLLNQEKKKVFFKIREDGWGGFYIENERENLTNLSGLYEEAQYV